MNRKQIISMWCGIVAIVFFGFVTIADPYRPEYGRLAVCVFITALITGGLIYTFKDRKRPEVETRKPVNLKRGFRRITLLLAIVTAVICVCIAVESARYKRIRSQNHLSYCERELVKKIKEIPKPIPDDWPSWSSEEVVSDYLQKLSRFLLQKQANLHLLTTDEAKNFRDKYGSCVEKARSLLGAYNFWVKLSTKQVIGLLVLIGLGCAIAGFCGIWAIYGLLRWAIIPIVRWATTGFHIDTQ